MIKVENLIPAIKINLIPESPIKKDLKIKFTVKKVTYKDYFKNLRALFIYRNKLEYRNLDVTLAGIYENGKNSAEKDKQDAIDRWCDENLTIPLAKMFGSEFNGVQYDAGEYWRGVANIVATNLIEDLHNHAVASNYWAQPISNHGNIDWNTFTVTIRKNNFIDPLLLEQDYRERLQIKSYNLKSFKTEEIKDGENTRYLIKGLNIDDDFSLYDIVTASMFESFNYYAYFTDTQNTPYRDFEIEESLKEKGINFHYLFFIDKIKFGALKMGDVNTIKYGMFDVKSFKESSSRIETDLSFNILGDEILTFYRYITQKVTGMYKALKGQEEHFNLHIIVPYKYTTHFDGWDHFDNNALDHDDVYAWHFLLENCRFTKVDKIRFDNKPTNSAPIHNVEMIYKQAWLYSECIKKPNA